MRTLFSACRLISALGSAHKMVRSQDLQCQGPPKLHCLLAGDPYPPHSIANRQSEYEKEALECISFLFSYLTVNCFIKCSSFIWSFELIFMSSVAEVSRVYRESLGRRHILGPFYFEAIFNVCCFKLVHFSRSSVFWEFFLFHHSLATCWFDGWWCLFTYMAIFIENCNYKNKLYTGRKLDEHAKKILINFVCECCPTLKSTNLARHSTSHLKSSLSSGKGQIGN